jgi:hypothetical protein
VERRQVSGVLSAPVQVPDTTGKRVCTSTADFFHRAPTSLHSLVLLVPIPVKIVIGHLPDSANNNSSPNSRHPLRSGRPHPHPPTLAPAPATVICTEGCPTPICFRDPPSAPFCHSVAKPSTDEKASCKHFGACFRIISARANQASTLSQLFGTPSERLTVKHVTLNVQYLHPISLFLLDLGTEGHKWHKFNCPGPHAQSIKSSLFPPKPGPSKA